MTEREIQFSDKEKSDIAEVARAVARVGEDCVWSLVQAMKVFVRGSVSGVVIDDVYYTPNQLRHEIDVVGEVINQSKQILQFEGRDTLSELSRHSEAAGLGSIFDPESEIRIRMKSYGFDHFNDRV